MKYYSAIKKEGGGNTIDTHSSTCKFKKTQGWLKGARQGLK